MIAPQVRCRVPAEARGVLGDRHFNTAEVRELCDVDARLLVTTQYGRYPHTDGGVEVRRVCHRLRFLAIDSFNEQFKGIFDGHAQVPPNGLVAIRRFALGAVLVYQLALWHRFEHGLDLNIGLKPFLKAA